MSKPTTPPDTTEEGYYIDLVSDEPKAAPHMVTTHLRHLLIACELGDLVLLECERRVDGKQAFVVCASVVASDNKRRLLPICEIEDTSDLLARFRPPVVAENGFVKPTHTGRYSACLLNDPEEVALAEVNELDDSVH